MIKFILTILLLTTVSVNAQTCSSLNKLDWLLGQWQTQNHLSLTTEQWTKLSDSTFEGAGATGNSQESLRLVAMSGEIFYLAKVSHNPVPVAFKLVQCINDLYTFKNSQHDFPNTIEYQRISQNIMQVKVSGKSTKSFTIQLYRVQNKTNNNKN
tara:strand:- start:288 stop:749 length:462 start_codon:yes stop_codon:yes gene_type:complete